MENYAKFDYKTSDGRTIDSVKWPNNYQCAVMLCFDYDAMFSRVGKGQGPVELSQCEFGPRVGIWRVMELLDRYDIKGTIYTVGLTAKLYPESVRELARRGHEITSHMWDHRYYSDISIEEEREKIQKTTAILTELSGVKPTGWLQIATTPNTLRLLEEDGYEYISNGMADDIPYWIKGSGLLAIPYQWIYDDMMFFGYVPGVAGRGLQNPSKVFEIWSEEFNGIYNAGRCFRLTTHPFVIGRGMVIKLLERFIIYMKQFPNVWFATCREVAEYWERAYPER
jgi:peptidoglycan/xylan/chitin deacetylase (PgdA/CDA1 family)